MTVPERFRPWPRDPRLLVGDQGTIIGVRGRPRRPSLNLNGYLQLACHRTGPGARKRNFKVHVMVCETFHGPRPTPKHEAAHGNGQPLDNWATNLRWATKAENEADKRRHGTQAHVQGERNGQSKLTAPEVRKIREQAAEGAHPRALAARFGVGRTAIDNIVSRDTWAWLADVP